MKSSQHFFNRICPIVESAFVKSVTLAEVYQILFRKRFQLGNGLSCKMNIWVLCNCKPFHCIFISIETTKLTRTQIFVAEFVTIVHYFYQKFKNLIIHDFMWLLINIIHVYCYFMLSRYRAILRLTVSSNMKYLYL